MEINKKASIGQPRKLFADKFYSRPYLCVAEEGGADAVRAHYLRIGVAHSAQKGLDIPMLIILIYIFARVCWCS